MPRKEQYTVEAIIVEGDGIPDGDLVTQYVNGKVKVRMFVPVKRLQVLVRTHSISLGKTTKKEPRFVYQKLPAIESTDKQVLVQGSSKFGQHIHKGAGEQAGAIGASALIQALCSLFVG